MPHHILIADGDPNLRFTLEFLLHHCGHEVSIAADGPEVLEGVRQRRPDLLLVDVQLAGFDGHQVCRALRGDPALQGLPVVLIGPAGGEAGTEHARAAGADAFLAKPFSSRALLQQIEPLLARGRVEA